MMEHFSQIDSNLLEYLSSFGSYYNLNFAPQVCVSEPDEGIQLHTIVDMKDADQIFKKTCHGEELKKKFHGQTVG